MQDIATRGGDMTRPVIGYLHERCLPTYRLRTELEALGQVRFVAPTPDELADIDILYLFAGFFFDRKLLTTAPRVVATIEIGTAIHCDVAAATDLGIGVFHNPGANAQAVAEHTIGLTLALSNGIMSSDRRMHTHEFQLAARRTWGIQLKGRTMGLIGFGNVARQVARIAKDGLDMRIQVWCRHPDEVEAAGYEAVELEELLKGADVVSVHLALNPDTHGLLDRAKLSLMKPEALFVNTARAEILDMDALAKLLADGQLAAAALDTWPNHEPDYSSPLFELDNVVLTEANAGLTAEAAENMENAVIDAVQATIRRTHPQLATVANPHAWPPRALHR